MATEGKNEQRMSKEYLSLLNITYHYLILLMRQFAEGKAEREGFEPSIRSKSVYTLSKHAPTEEKNHSKIQEYKMSTRIMNNIIYLVILMPLNSNNNEPFKYRD